MQSTLALTLTRRLGVRQNLLADSLLVVIGSLLVALLAQVRIYLPFSPVPVTGQTLAVLLVASALGARRGTAALTVYLLAGLAGLPVFAGGAFGLTRLFGPTGGYLLGFIVAAGVVGFLAEKGWDRRWYKVLAMFLAGELVIYVFGLSGLALYVGWQNAFSAGLFPFLIGDAVKALSAAALLPLAWKFLK